MLSCGACRERCLQTVVGQSIFPTPLCVWKGPVSVHDSFSRSYHNSKQRKSRRPEHLSPNYRKKTAWLQPKNKYGTSTEHDKTPRILATGGVPLRRKDYKMEQSMAAVLQRHQTYANDPLKLAEFVRKSLRGDDWDTAVSLVRAASKHIQCTVSWNHLIDWELSKGKMNAALKTYNEMKKRGQTPDSHTFTIIIRGCTEHRDLKAALGKVMAMFQAMQLDKSPVKPNTIHLNAILKMCARARDMEAMFAIMAQMPTRGPSSPNNLTYTTIINALRMDAVSNFRGELTPVQKRQNAEKAILQARHLWRDIIKSWRSGGFWLDEELVCAMGRLMLIGQHQDWNDILSLVEQSLNIPRQVPRMGSPGRRSIELATQRGHSPDDASSQSAASPTETSMSTFIPTTPPETLAPGALSAYAKPGRNSLSLVLQTLLLMKMKEPADRYWQVFVSKVGVKPDSENYHAYMRILRLFRASSQTLELLQSMPQHEMRGATFRIAMATCDRDKHNHHAFANAGKILDIMTDALRIPDIRVLATYLDIATSATVEGGPELSRLAQGKQIMRALERLRPHYRNGKSFYLFGEQESDLTPKERAEYNDALLLLCRRMIAAYDILMNKALVDRSRYKELHAERGKLAAFVTRQKEQRETSTTKAFQLPDELLEYVYTRDLNKVMDKAKVRPELWKSFVERTKRAYDADKKATKLAAEVGKDPTSDRLWEKVAEEERQAAEMVVKGVFAQAS